MKLTTAAGTGRFTLTALLPGGCVLDHALSSLAQHSRMHGSEQYNSFKRANARYEQHLAATREPGEYLFPRGRGNHRDYIGMPIKDIPQDVVWWALRPSNRHQRWVCRSNSASPL